VAFCSTCGAPLDEDARFCEQCGAEREPAAPGGSPEGASREADGEEAGATSADEQPSPEAAAPGFGESPEGARREPGEPSRRPRKRLVLVLAGATVLVAVALLLVFLLPRYFGEGAARRAAEASIDAFAGKKTAVEFRSKQAYLGGELMRFTRKQGEREIDYYVDSETKRVMRMDDFDTSAYEVKIDLPAAHEVATAYVRKHFAQARAKGLRLVEQRLVDHGDGTAKYYSFTWLQKDKASGAALPVAATARVDPVSGVVFSYDSLDVPVTVGTSPKVSAEDAGTKALQAVGADVPGARVESATLAVSTDPPNDPRGAQALVWQVIVAGDDPEGYATGASVYIEAVSGKVLAVEPFS
jgi:hypothetical protein